MEHTVKWSEQDNVYIATSTKYPSVQTHGPTKRRAIKNLQLVVKVIDKRK
jgi:hypothetical protein